MLRKLPPLALIFAVACSRPPDSSNASSSNSQALPFDRQPRTSGASPSQSLIPPSARIPAGTPLVVRLSQPISSATAHIGDSFEGSLDEPVVVDQQTLLPGGTLLSGQVLDAKPASGMRDSGYLRITIVSFQRGGKTSPIATSSIFRNQPYPSRPLTSGSKKAKNDVLFTPDHHLTFRLAQAVDIQ